MAARSTLISLVAILLTLTGLQFSTAIVQRTYQHRRETSLTVFNSTHDYYELSIFEGTNDPDLWLTPDNTWTSYRAEHRTFVTVPLTFSFPFYGTKIRSVHVAAGGFISTLPEDETLVTVASYYIAPLLADFHSGNTTEDTVFFKDFGESFVVQWTGVVLHSLQTKKPFSFQCVLQRSGHISFYYKNIPLTPNLIRMDEHPVSVGLAESYTRTYDVDGQEQMVRYDYHSIDVPKTRIQNTTRISFEPLPTCGTFRSCDACAHHDTVFDCVWCPALTRCSDGFDRFRDEFVEAGCDENNITPEEADQCEELALDTYVYTFAWPSTNFSSDCWYWLAVRVDQDQSKLTDRMITSLPSGGVTVSFAMELTTAESHTVLEYMTAGTPLRCDGTMTVVSGVKRTGPSSSFGVTTETIILISCAGVLALLIIAFISVMMYGYTHPTSSLGQWMIRHRRCRDLCYSSSTGSNDIMLDNIECTPNDDRVWLESSGQQSA
eukprot:m.29761 g.29761  ORF g.29761 m.29761 type:complete len:491 (-) comp10549_c0_seq1:73-1545(-)